MQTNMAQRQTTQSERVYIRVCVCEQRPFSKQTSMVTEADNTIRESEEVLNGGISSPSIVNVQEMVRCNLSCIPDRFKRSEEDKSKGVDLSVLSPQIPVIDLALLSSENVEELKKLEWACKCWGFFMVILLFISLHFSMHGNSDRE